MTAACTISHHHAVCDHAPSGHDEEMIPASSVVTRAIFLTRHAAARVWRHIVEDPETPAKTRAALLNHLPEIEADPVGADWERAYSVAYTAYDASNANATITAYLAANAADAAYLATRAVADYYATANATRAVGLGCAGSDRIGLALTLLADQDAELTDPTTAWELSGLVTAGASA